MAVDTSSAPLCVYLAGPWESPDERSQVSAAAALPSNPPTISMSLQHATGFQSDQPLCSFPHNKTENLSKDARAWTEFLLIWTDRMTDGKRTDRRVHTVKLEKWPISIFCKSAQMNSSRDAIAPEKAGLFIVATNRVKNRHNTGKHTQLTLRIFSHALHVK